MTASAGEDHGAVFNDVSKLRISVLERLQRDWRLHDLEYLAHLVAGMSICLAISADVGSRPKIGAMPPLHLSEIFLELFAAGLLTFFPDC